MTSVAQIVRKIIDDLSDGVSELVLLVVILSEQNAALPDELPSAAEIVIKTADNLAKIARELAKTDYVDFADIAKEINAASNSVNSSTASMSAAIKVLQGTNNDRKKGWSNLIDACRVMAGKTIQLLQIVYGADLKRLQLAADKLEASISTVDPKDLLSEAGRAKVVADMTDVAQQAVKLAQYLNDRADDPGISPFAQELLKKAAGNLRDRAQELINAANEALMNPEMAPKMQAALDNLRNEAKQGKKLATEYAPEAPKMEALQKLLPLLERAEQKVADLPHVVKTNPKKFDDAENDVKAAVQDVIRNIRPNPKRKRDVDKLEDDLKDQILAARKALQNPKNPELDKELEDATKALLDALKNLKRTNPDNKVTPEQKNEIKNALENLKKTFGPAIYKKPEDKEQDAYERLKDDLDKLKDAVMAGEPKLINNKVRMAVQAAKDLGGAMSDPERLKKLPPAQRKAKEDAAKDLLDSLPRFIKNAGAVLKDPNDPEKQENLMDAIRNLKRIADRPNKPKDERDLFDNYNDILNGLNKVKDRIQNKDPKGAEDAMNDIANALANLRKAGDRLKEKSPNPHEIEKPISELEKIFEKIRNKAAPAAKGDHAAARAIDESIPQIKRAWDDLDHVTHASDIAPIDDFEDAVDDVVLAASSDDPSRVAPALKQLVQNLNDLGAHADKLRDPRAKQIAKESIENKIKPLMREYATKAKEVAEKKASPDELVDIANRIKAPLADIKKAVSPTSKDRDPEVAGVAVKKALEDLRKALKGGDPAKIQEALKNLKNKLDTYNGLVDQATKTIADPRKRKLLNADVTELNELSGDLRRLHPTDRRVAALLDQIPDRMANWHENLGNTEADDARKAFAKANNLLATLGSLDEDEMDLSDLLGTAGQLRNLMRGLIGDTAALARQLGTTEKELSPAAKAALEMDRFLNELETYGEPTPAAIRSPIPPAPLSSETSFDPADDKFFEQISLSQATTFDQVLAAVANEMHHAAKNMSQEADKVAIELAKLAKAARGGSKQDMLVAAKSASAYINAFCKQMDTLAKKIPGRTLAEKKEQDNLIRYQQALKNYATQLKILASVKAASIESSRDTDATLKTLTLNLGDVIHASLRSMATTRDAIFGGKIPITNSY